MAEHKPKENQLCGDVDAHVDGLEAELESLRAALREAEAQRDALLARIHPWYGPCDGFADGECVECQHLQKAAGADAWRIYGVLKNQDEWTQAFKDAETLRGRAEAAEREVDEYRQALGAVRKWRSRWSMYIENETAKQELDALLARDALRVEQPRPERWHEGMREYQPETCWAFVGEDDVCIRLRGHDGGRHEPVAESSRHDLRTANWPEWQEDDLAEADALRVEQPRQEGADVSR